MKKLTIAAATVVILLAGNALAQIGAKKEGDHRVKALLDKADLNYEVDKDGDYRLINGLENDRTQIVFIFSNTSNLGNMEIREIWSVGYLSDSIMPSSVAKDLLSENRIVKLGAWELGRFNGKEAGVFRAKIAADTDVKTLLMTLQAVSKTADEKEEELMSKDDL
jgi:hypothetical protein